MKTKLLIVLILLASCAPQKRFNRLVTKYPHLLTTDTVTITDTIRVYVPEVSIDTIIEEHQLFDTVYLEKEQLKVKVWMTKDRKVYIQGKCDTVYIDKIITRKIPVKYYEKTPLYKKLIDIILVILVTLSIAYFIFRK